MLVSRLRRSTNGVPWNAKPCCCDHGSVIQDAGTMTPASPTALYDSLAATVKRVTSVRPKTLRESIVSRLDVDSIYPYYRDLYVSDPIRKTVLLWSADGLRTKSYIPILSCLCSDYWIHPWWRLPLCFETFETLRLSYASRTLRHRLSLSTLQCARAGAYRIDWC